MNTVRYSKVVEIAGKPNVHVLWIDPAKDAALQKAIHANRVMTVHQRPVDSKADYGTIGFQKGASGQVLIFPKTLKPFIEKRVVGVKYDLLDWPAVAKGRQAHKVRPARQALNDKPQDTKVSVGAAKQPETQESPTRKIVKFRIPKAEDKAGLSTEIEEVKGQVRHAMKLLEAGKQVAAFNLLKHIVGS